MQNITSLAKDLVVWMVRRCVATGLVVLALGAGAAHATHERAALISWDAAGGNTIDFEVQSAWRRSGYALCRNPSSPVLATQPCTGPGGGPGVGNVILENVGNTRLNFGDGSDVGSPGAGGGLAYVVTSIDAANDWLFAEALDPSSLPSIDETIAHTYASSAPQTAFIQACCRIAAVSGSNRHINNPEGDYRIETTVNPGGGNSPPTSSMPPIVLCPQNGICTFAIPAADPDEDTITFRLSTDLEAAGPGNNFNQPGEADPSANASINPTTGVYTWNTAGATLGPVGTNTYYSTQVTIEDRDGDNNVKSKIAVDFLIQLVVQAGVAPSFSQPTCGSTINVNPGDPVSFTVQASDTDFGQTVTLNVAGLPVGASMTPGLPTTGNPVSSVFSWTPTVTSTGPHVVNFSATDSASLQTSCAVTVVVASCQNDTDCDDGDLCTTDVCDPGDPGATVGGCVYPDVTCDACQTCDSGLGCTGAVCTPPPTETPTDTPTAPPTPTETPTLTATVTPTSTETPPGNTGFLCAPTPLSGCRAPSKSLLILKNDVKDEKDNLIWKWIRGAETSLGDLGTPTDSTVYRLCVYTGAGSMSVMIPPGSNWRAFARGFKFKDKTAAIEGARKVLLKSGPTGRAKAIVKGKGTHLQDEVVPMLTLPVTAQLVNSANSVCYSTTFETADKNDAKRFKAKKLGP